ncbi:hypothetical protein CPH92_00850 [Malaciobacter marinus]|uniref:Cryptochrome/DNA photolyase FAD-binding domain-containing protein n=1 Tax=Malaciobacter marinus TaxID=505249 RepID=A0ABX4M1Y7_9BACT|nr:hypothetical protein CPH92_00850 [Malaciobacter marinus]
MKNLGIDFRIVAAFFESYLIDYNPASNYGNIAYQAFVGNDKTYRVFDVIKQSKQYGGRVYTNKWLNKNQILIIRKWMMRLNKQFIILKIVPNNNLQLDYNYKNNFIIIE